MHLNAQSALPTIRLAFLSNKVDESVCGDYEDVCESID